MTPSSGHGPGDPDDPAEGSDGPGYPSPGLLPVLPDDSDSWPPPEKTPSSNAATGASAAGVRALTSQAVAFYFRAPVKAFFRTRVDYLAYARALQEQEQEQEHARRRQQRVASAGVAGTTTISNQHAAESGRTVTASTSTSTSSRRRQPPSSPSSPPSSALSHWLRTRLRGTTPGLLASAVRRYGWRVVPDQVLPPLAANVGVGAVLYTSYLQVLARLHPESGRASRRVYPPPTPAQTFAAGLVAGAVQSVVTAPLDAVQARYDLGKSAAGMTGSGNRAGGGGRGGGVASGNGNGNGNGGGMMERPKSMWAFSAAKLREIGVRGIFAGWGLSFVKDSLGSAVFFSVFEYLKAQGYYRFVTWYYGSLNEDTIILLARKRPGPPAAGGRQETASDEAPRMPTVIRPHYAIEPAFLLLAGMGASVAQQVVLHPLSHVQAEHWERLESLDAQARKIKRHAKSSDAPSKSDSAWRWRMLQAYRDAYRITWAECVAEARAAGLSMPRWLYRGFWWNTIRQVPSTSAGLIIFELVRRKYGLGEDQVRINRDGYDILLS
ncbi:hypothetical protein VTK56DRAFT_9515 [Thermocarpiscus australiensis]